MPSVSTRALPSFPTPQTRVENELLGNLLPTPLAGTQRARRKQPYKPQQRSAKDRGEKMTVGEGSGQIGGERRSSEWESGKGFVGTEEVSQVEGDGTASGLRGTSSPVSRYVGR